MPLNGDVGWWLHISRAMLAGEVLYRDLIEINPPMNAYISMIPAWASGVSGLPIAMMSKVFTLALVLGITVWVTALSRRTGVSNHSLPIIAATVIVAAALLPGHDFAQREHLMFVLILPYTLVLWNRGRDRHVPLPSALAAGLAAGVGLALKPHFLLVPIALEVVSRLEAGAGERGSWRRVCTPERMTVLGVLTMYGLLVLLRSEYVSLLRMTASTYAHFSSVDRVGLALSEEMLGLLACLLGVSRTRSEVGTLARYLVAVGAATLMLAILQGKGWTYHFYPVVATVASVTLLVAYDFGTRAWKSLRDVRLADMAVMALFATVALHLVTSWTAAHDEFAAKRNPALAEQVKYLADMQAQGSFLVLTAIVGLSFPLVNYTGLEWASPFPSMWWIRARPERRRRNPPGEDVADIRIEDSTERILAQMLVTKFRQSAPGTVLVDTVRYADLGGASFPFVDYLKQYEQFRLEWRHYEREGEVGPFVVWVRRPLEDSVKGPGGDDAS